MKLKIKPASEPNMVAVVGAPVGGDARGIYFRSNSGGTVYVSADRADAAHIGTMSLEEVAKGPGRISIYEGDEITIKF